MTDINTVNLIGHLTKDVKITEVSSVKKADLTIAVNRSYKKNDNWVDEASFIDLLLWSPTEHQQKTLLKGCRVAVSGWLKQERWEKNGNKYSRIIVVVTQLQILKEKSEKTEQNNTTSNTTSSSMPSDDEIPF